MVLIQFDRPCGRILTEMASGGLRARMRAFHDSPYRGDAADGLVTYLTENDESFEHPRKSPQGRRGKFCSVVQSAASGKSRTLIEVRHLISM